MTNETYDFGIAIPYDSDQDRILSEKKYAPLNIAKRKGIIYTMQTALLESQALTMQFQLLQMEIGMAWKTLHSLL